MKRMLAVAAFALALAAPAAADSDYTDATGENAAAADISTIHVANSPSAGTITFTVNLTNLPTMADDASILLFIDADQNPSTGQTGVGADYLFGLDSGGWYWMKWDPAANDFADVAGANLLVTFNNGVMSASIAAADIASPKAFNFVALTVRGTDPNNPILDSAPETGWFNYTLTVPPPTVVSTDATFGVGPKSGKPFVVKSLAVDLSNGTTAKATGLKCTATLGGATFRGVGAGGCTFKLPKTAKGKKLSVRVTGSYTGTPVVKTKTFKVG